MFSLAQSSTVLNEATRNPMQQHFGGGRDPNQPKTYVLHYLKKERPDTKPKALEMSRVEFLSAFIDRGT
jgi:hypothetical protein